MKPTEGEVILRNSNTETVVLVLSGTKRHPLNDKAELFHALTLDSNVKTIRQFEWWHEIWFSVRASKRIE